MFPIAIDRLSFWLGFLAASLLWWLWSRLRRMLPAGREQLRQRLNQIRQRNLSGVEQFLRRDTLERAQRMHLAAPLFSLDEIALQPLALAPPLYGDVTVSNDQAPLAEQVIPYLPDWPELTAQLAVPRLTLAQAFQDGRNLAIVGQPGSGKTVMLAHFASQLARAEEHLGAQQNALPVLLHMLDFPSSAPEGADPLALLLSAVTRTASPVVQVQAVRFARAALQTRRIVLLLDGGDEVPPERMREACALLALLHQKYPRLQSIVVSGPAYIDGLSQIGFLPLSVAGWSRAQREALTTRWHALWMQHIQPEVEKAGSSNGFDPLAIPAWLRAETAYYSPLEWTLRVWGAYAGDASGGSARANLTQYLIRYLPDLAALPGLGAIAAEMLRLGTGSIALHKAEQILSKTLSGRGKVQEEQETGAESAGAQKQRAGAPGDEMPLEALRNAGVLIEHNGQVLRFASPALTGLLAGRTLALEETNKLWKTMHWPVAEQTLRWAAVWNPTNPQIAAFLQQDHAPLHQQLFTVARWLAEAPANATWRTPVLRGLAALAQRKDQPFSTALRAAGALGLSRDPNTAAFFRQQLGKPDINARRAALLGCTTLAAAELVPLVVERLADLESDVRLSACYALAALPGQSARDAIITILLEGEELLRQAAAEALAGSADGYELLREAVTTDDLLTRRAAVLGLIQVHEPWADRLLEQIAVEDGQWVVRNAAAQAVEGASKEIGLKNWIHIRSLPAPWDADWLIKVAGRAGRGMVPDQPATETLLAALSGGSPEEQRLALQYLRGEPSEGVILAIYNLLYSSTEESVREAALQALWWVSLTGVTLPEPAQYGLG